MMMVSCSKVLGRISKKSTPKRNLGEMLLRVSASGWGCEYQVSQCGRPTSAKKKEIGESQGVFCTHVGVGVRDSVFSKYLWGIS